MTSVKSSSSFSSAGVDDPILEILPESKKLQFHLKEGEGAAQCSMTLRHPGTTGLPIAFKVKTARKGRYLVRSSQGAIDPSSEIQVKITLVEKETKKFLSLYGRRGQPALDACQDKFLVEWCCVPASMLLFATNGLQEIWASTAKENVSKEKLSVHLTVQGVDPPEEVIVEPEPFLLQSEETKRTDDEEEEEDYDLEEDDDYEKEGEGVVMEKLEEKEDNNSPTLHHDNIDNGDDRSSVRGEESDYDCSEHSRGNVVPELNDCIEEKNDAEHSSTASFSESNENIRDEADYDVDSDSVAEVPGLEQEELCSDRGEAPVSTGDKFEEDADYDIDHDSTPTSQSRWWRQSKAEIDSSPQGGVTMVLEECSSSRRRLSKSSELLQLSLEAPNNGGSDHTVFKRSAILKHPGKTQEHLAFKVKTGSDQQQRYLVRPVHGTLAPLEEVSVQIELLGEAQEELLQSYRRHGQTALEQYPDKFLIQSCRIPEDIQSQEDPFSSAANAEVLSRAWLTTPEKSDQKLRVRYTADLVPDITYQKVIIPASNSTAVEAEAALSTPNGITTEVKDDKNIAQKKNKEEDAKKNLSQPATFSALFQFAEPKDKLLFAIGLFFSIISSATMPAINIVFGNIVDSIASPIATEDLVNESVVGMLVLGCYGFVTFLLSFYLCGHAATNIANNFRMKYLNSLLYQDMAFFDNAEPGTLTMMMSDSALTIQTGLSDKFVQGVQGVFQFVFGFAIAFYFGPLLSLVLLGCCPILGAIATAMFMWGESDGIFGKAAYEQAAGIANEAISNIRTVISLNAEPKMSNRYCSRLGIAQKAAIRQGTRSAILSALLFGIMFAMYGLGFWFGSIMIANSNEKAIENHPPPNNLMDPDGLWFNTITMVCSQYLDDFKALEICACALPWDSLGITSPNCGCGFDLNVEAESLGLGVVEGCYSGGRTLMVFFSILVGVFAAGQIGPGIKALADARTAAGRMLAVINRKPIIGGKNDDSGKAAGKRLNREDVKGEITFENVKFHYTREPDSTSGADSTSGGDSTSGEDGADLSEQELAKPVFAGCDLTMEAGETIALVGESGCGKSTIAKLIQRFYDPTGGRILLDGTDLKDIHTGDLRSCIGVVSQEPILFDSTIEDNIRYGKSDATIDEIMKAAACANAHEFIMGFPDGYQTEVGPKGGKLSGGQKQRVAIARAILRDPAILILDEATSALDSRSEKLVQQALDELIKHGDGTVSSRSRTTIVIAHRLSTVRNADKIVVLGSPEGTSTVATGSIILEQGCHDELMQLEKGFYRSLIGAGKKSSAALVDDSGPERSSILLAFESKTFTEEESEAHDDVIENKEDEKGFFASMFSRKDAEQLAKEEAEKKQAAANKSRVWQYTKPEMGWIVIGACGSIVKGAILPLLSIVFSDMISVWYNSDLDYMLEQSLTYSYLFYGIAAISVVTEVIQKGIFEMIGERLTKRLRGDVFRSMLQKDIAWFEDENNSVGILASRLSTDVKLVRLVVGQSVAATLESISALTTGIIIAATASWQMFLIMVSLVPALAITEALQFTAMKSSEGTIKEHLSKSTGKLHETVSAIREVQSFLLQRLFIDDIEHRIKESVLPASRKAAVGKGFMMGMIQLVQFSVYAFAFWFGGRLIEKGSITMEGFNKALWAMAFAASGLGQAALFGGDAAKAAAAMKTIFETLDYKAAIESEPWENEGIANMKSNEVTVRGIRNSTLKDGKGELSKVNFAYPTRKTAKVYDQIDLRIPSGKVVALVGSSGSGKSTIVQLLLRFYDPISYEGKDSNDEELLEIVVDDGTLKTSDGVVSIDDKDIRLEDIRWLRSNMGYVGQEPVLFNDTIYNNIAMGKDNCTRDEVEAAARHANAYDFISKQPEGFDTEVGLGGGKVSGGQKQRIAIARALVGDPKILILDEATSALDNESEKIVQESLDSLMKESDGKRTTIVIAHRLSTIKGADCICVLDNQGDGSKVVEVGTHDELIALGQKYQALVQAYEDN